MMMITTLALLVFNVHAFRKAGSKERLLVMAIFSEHIQFTTTLSFIPTCTPVAAGPSLIFISLQLTKQHGNRQGETFPP